MKGNILNKKIKVNKRLASFIIFFGVFFFSQLLIASYRFLNNEHNKFFSTLNTTKKYVAKHENELKEEVFNKLFKESEKCNLIYISDSRKKCFKDISHKLALIIKEEEFSYWPMDIFFVKRNGNQLSKLGWSGETKIINPPANNETLNNKESLFSDFIFRKCNYFDNSDSPVSSCEIFIKLELGSNQEGYIVRSVGFTDEDDFIFYLLIPYFVLFGTITYFSLPKEIKYYIELLIIIIPLIISFFSVKLCGKKLIKNFKFKI